jgi:2-methylaconitate cis-trans-isomerase PrpF
MLKEDENNPTSGGFSIQPGLISSAHNIMRLRRFKQIIAKQIIAKEKVQAEKIKDLRRSLLPIEKVKVIPQKSNLAINHRKGANVSTLRPRNQTSLTDIIEVDLSQSLNTSNFFRSQNSLRNGPWLGDS